MDSNILHLEKLNYNQVNKLNRDRTVIFITISPIEEHGPHLPLGVDFFNATYFTNEAAKQLAREKPDWTILLTPPLALGVHIFDHAGSISIRYRVIKDLVYDYCKSLVKHGFKYIIITSSHGGLGHLIALDSAARKIIRKYGAYVLSLTGEIIPKFLSGDFAKKISKHLDGKYPQDNLVGLNKDTHAGQWETSMMLMLYPDLVDASYKDLEPMTFQPKEQLVFNYPLKKGNKLGYVGYPNRADVEFAKASSRVLLDESIDIINDLLTNHKYPKSSKVSMKYRLFIKILKIIFQRS